MSPMNAVAPIRSAAVADHPERQYLGLLAEILANGVERSDRNPGTTVSVTHTQIAAVKVAEQAV